MGDTILAPIALSETVQDGRRRFWKQILPVTSIDYDGQKIDFDPDFHTDLSDAFKGGAYDQVPLMFAGEKNEHNMDPRNFGGDIVKVEYRGPAKGQGTWALIEADKTAARVLKRNPKLGVSARIRQGVEKADGRFFKRAINHVLLTMNPRIGGMSPWQAVDLSEDTGVEVVDLTAQEYKEGNPMGKGTTTRRGSRRQIDLSALSDEEFNRLLDLAQTAVEDPVESDEDVDDDLEDDEVDDEIEDPAETPRRKKSKVKVTKTTERDVEDSGHGDDPEDDEFADTELSERVIRRDEVSQFGQMRIDLAQRDWNTKRERYLANGVPAYLLDLAEPVLSQPDKVTLDLSEGEDHDVTDTITKMLDGVQHIVDLGDEIGSSLDVDLSEEEASEADALLKEWNENYSA